MDATSPAKRRVLGELNPNASLRLPSPQPKGLAPPKMSQLASPFRLQTAPPDLHLTPLPAMSPCGSPRKHALDEHDPRGSQRKRSRLDCDSRSGSYTEGRSDVERRDWSSSPVGPHNDSHAESSVFDNSTVDVSQATNVTVPDAQRIPAAPPAPAATVQQPRRWTPEELRQKAEMLRARLRLANYKVRTGQVEVPFDQLQLLPVPCGHVNCTSCPRKRARQEASASSFREESSTARSTSISVPSAARLQRFAEMSLARSRDLKKLDDSDESINLPSPHPQTDSEDGDEVIITLPPLPARKDLESASPNTPQRQTKGPNDERLSSSALRGGAASGLLSLSRS
ncbi:hypothetical protein QBC47DRAFT_393373 [Echria macrotheca]|uniref:Uncharacterized protein n=1 Tax=Echria macrotheca TaxID=438768 RepID=A0AAJ0B3W0_9PEZI|nr:hypothetical protein QBC47DRAFT_393373 [Echria macrotheca]